MLIRTSWLAALALLCFVASPVAASLMHSDVMGDDFAFTNISEDSPSGDPLPLYNQPIVLEGGPGTDQLEFFPTAAFSALSEDGGVDFTDGKLRLTITAKGNNTISSILFEESGLAKLFKQPAAGDDPFAAISGLVDIDIVEASGSPILSVELPGLMLGYTPSDGTYQHSVDASGPLFTVAWNGSLSVDIGAVVADATQVNLTIDNSLLGSTAALGSLAFVDKKDFQIIVTSLPEPSALILGLLGMLGIHGLARRRA